MAATQPVAVSAVGGPTMLDKPHKFELLDAMRGIAALIVVYFHQTSLFVDPAAHPELLFRHGWLAVDFFFVLSGFVISYSYQAKLDGGLSTLDFLKLRLVRLYPLYLLGTALGFYHHIFLEHGLYASSGRLGPYLLLLAGLCFLPVLRGWHNAFPYDGPTWSLFCELGANVVHGLFLRRRSARVLAGVCAAGAIALLVCLARFGTLAIGTKSLEILPSLARVIFSYVAGMLLFRFWRHGAKGWRVPVAVPIVLLVCVLGVPAIAYERTFELLAVFALLPATALLAACSSAGPRFVVACRVLGTLSYAIYVLHEPVAGVFEVGWRRFAPSSMPWAAPSSAPWPGVSVLVLVCVLAMLLERFYDIPVRRTLRRASRL